MAFLMTLFSVWGWGQSTYTLVTSVSGLEAGAKYLIADGTSGSVSLLGYQNTNNRPEVSGTVTSGTITITPATLSGDQTKPFEITLGGASGAWVLNDEVTGIVLGPSKGNNGNNYLKGNTVGTPTYTISFSSNAAVMTCVGSERNTDGAGRNIIRYNSQASLFSSYSSGQAAVYLYKKNIPTWNGTQWVGGTPTAATGAIIAGNYTGNGFTAQSLTVNQNNTLTINNGQTVTAGNVSNNGNIIVNDGGNFVQTTGGVYTAGTGSSFISNRNSASVGGKYVFWSSPIANQNIYTAYLNGSSATAPSYVMTYDTTTNLYPNVLNDNANFTNNAGKGYSVKVPSTSATLAFGGSSQVPNNGTVSVALAGTSGGINNFNLIGNPYPSNLDLNAFYSANQSLLNSTFWFWDNTTGNVTTQTGNTSVNVGYATVNAADPAGNTWVEAPGTQTYNNTVLNATGNIAKVGQGFIVKAIDAGNVSFTNAMRSSSVGGTLNKNAGSGKFWIKLTTSYGNTVTQAITYSQGASDAYDVYDSKAMGMGSDAFYSLVGAEKLVIQGKSTFHIDDVVQLGNKHFENGNFTISLSHKEGLFANGQDIYLHDKQTGTYTNLQTGAYSFSANAGDFTNRFEIVYKLNVLSTAETQKGTFEVYRDGENFVVRNNKNIQSVEVFDAAGRKIEQVTSNSKSVTVKVQAKGLYILKAVSEGKEYTQKIIK